VNSPQLRKSNESLRRPKTNKLQGLKKKSLNQNNNNGEDDTSALPTTVNLLVNEEVEAPNIPEEVLPTPIPASGPYNFSLGAPAILVKPLPRPSSSVFTSPRPVSNGDGGEGFGSIRPKINHSENPPVSHNMFPSRSLQLSGNRKRFLKNFIFFLLFFIL
jgi:hypothetical protein